MEQIKHLIKHKKVEFWRVSYLIQQTFMAHI